MKIHLPPWILFAAAGWIPGCAGYQPRPLQEVELLRELQAIRLESLGGSPPAGIEAPPPAAGAFDAADGVSADEAVAAALFLNPDLRAFRLKRGAAEAEVAAAGLLPNPQLEVSWFHIEHFTRSLGTSAFDAALEWAPPRPGERSARKARAGARLREALAQIAAEEWRLAGEVRSAHTALQTSEERLRLAESSLSLQTRIRSFVRERRELGDASSLDVNLVDLELAEGLREREQIAGERDAARLHLNRLLGLSPRYDLRIEPRRLDRIPANAGLAEDRLEAVLLKSRPDLQAAREAYRHSEEDLRLAYLQRWPWFRLGPAYARDEIDGRGGNRWGVGLGIELPVANFNQGEILKLESAREMARQDFIARLQGARFEAGESLQRLQLRDRLLRIYEESVLPALEENNRLTEAGFQLKDLDILELITMQEKVLKSRRHLLEARLEYWKAVFDLEKALGVRMGDILQEGGAS